MSEGFDAYHKWLGIPPKHQPPDHYRLLAIEQFEDDPDVISHAADQRMIHLRVFQAGEHAALCQKILTQIASARICLLAPSEKAAYDASLRSQHPWVEPAPPQPPIAPPTAEPPEEGNKIIWILTASLGGVAAVVLLGFAVYLLNRSSDDSVSRPLAGTGTAGSSAAAELAADRTVTPAAPADGPPQSGDLHDGKRSGEPAGRTEDQPPPHSDDFHEPGGALRKNELAAGEPAKRYAAPQNAQNQPPPAGDKPQAAPVDNPPEQQLDKWAVILDDLLVLRDRIIAKSRPANLLELTADNVSLPAVDSVEPLELGKAVIKERSDLTISIEGGHSGHGGKGAFTVAAAAGADDALAWEIRHGPADGRQAPVARLAIAGQKLTFNWLPAAATSSDAKFLRNCVLTLNAGQTTKALRLREPQRVEPQQIAVTKSGLKPLPFRHEIAFLPNPASVFVEFRLNPDLIGPGKMVPEEGRTDNAVPAARGTLLILLDEGGAVGLKMQVKKARNKLLVTAAPVLHSPHAEKQQPFFYAELKKAHMKKSEWIQFVSSRLDELIKLQHNRIPSKNRQKRIAEIERGFQRMLGVKDTDVIKLQLDKVITEQEHTNKSLVFMEGLIEQLQDVLSSGGKKLTLLIEIRVYRAMGAVQVDLLKSSGWETATP